MNQTPSAFELRTPFAYIETTIPPGMTIAEYRRSRPRRDSRWDRLLRRIRSTAAGSGAAS